MLFRPAAPAREALPSPDPPLSIGTITTDPPSADTGAMTDGDHWTSWVGPTPQQGTETVTVDLGTARRIRAVRIALGSRPAEYPRRLIVETSADARPWTAAWEGGTAAAALRSALADQREVPLTVDIGERTARYIRLRQVGHDDRYPWSIAELQVLPPSLP